MGDAEDRAAELRKLAVDLAKDGNLDQAASAAALSDLIAEDAKNKPGEK